MARKYLDYTGLTHLIAKIKEAINGAGIPVVDAASSNGTTYTATVDGITSLKKGTTIVIVPAVVSTSTNVTLNVNSLGAKQIRMMTGHNSGTVVVPANSAWLSAGYPVQVRYNGTMWVADMQRTYGSAIYGTVPIEHGGTGADNAADARTNLGLTSLKNPYALTFSGAVSETYDGSAEKTINIPTVPTALKNPAALTFTGSASGSYDGSSAKTVNIPTVPSSLKNPNALTIHGQSYDGSAAVSVELFSYGTEDLEAGVSALETGKLYFVYE